MRAYRCYLMNRAGMIAATELLECDGDGDAQQAALKLFREGAEHFAVEVWDEARQVYRQTRGTA